jgi:SAM-dependent methyltransferase
MSAAAPDSSCARHDPATQTPNWPAWTWLGRWWQPPGRSPPPKLAVRYVHGRAECLPFTDDVFDLVFTTLSLRHWTNPAAGSAEIGRVLTPGGLRVLTDVLPSYHRRGPVVAMLRRRHAVVPAELGAVLAAHRLAVIGCDHTRWIMLPDIQVIAAQQPHQPSANPSTQRHPPRFAT